MDFKTGYALKLVDRITEYKYETSNVYLKEIGYFCSKFYKLDIRYTNFLRGSKYVHFKSCLISISQINLILLLTLANVQDKYIKY